MRTFKHTFIRINKSRKERFGSKKWEQLSLREQMRFPIWRTMLFETRNAENYYKGEE
jgi:hypothetical protein